MSGNCWKMRFKKSSTRRLGHFRISLTCDQSLHDSQTGMRAYMFFGDHVFAVFILNVVLC